MANVSSSIGVVYISCFYLGMGLIGRFACGFVMLTESLPKRHQAFGGTAAMIGDVVATLYICLFLRYISNNANTLIWVGFAINVITVIFGLFLVESPGWLVSVGRTEDAAIALQKIAKINGATDFQVGKLIDEKFVIDDPNKKESEVAKFGGAATDGDNDEITEQRDANKKLLDSSEDKLDTVAARDG